jgi:hypothetical protein
MLYYKDYDLKGSVEKESMVVNPHKVWRQDELIGVNRQS